MDFTEEGDRSARNQSQRLSATPISCCHCCAPRRCERLYQTATPFLRNIWASRSAYLRSRLACERNTCFGRRDLGLTRWSQRALTQTRGGGILRSVEWLREGLGPDAP